MSWQHFREERWKKYDEACMLDRLKKYPDWDYISTDANASAEKQNADIETLISRGVNALLIVPYSIDAVKPAAQVALANGIPTVGYDIQIEEPGIFYLSFDNAEVGRIQARGVVDVVNKGRFAYIKGSPTMEITEFVWGGQVDILTPYIESGDIEIVCELYSDGWLPENAQINMEQCLTANDNNVDAVVASNDGTAGGVVAALASQETRMVGDLIKRLKSQGIGIFLISHDIHDVFDLSDRITVLNGGQVVDTVQTQNVTKDQVLGMIILGKRIEEETEEDLASLH